MTDAPSADVPLSDDEIDTFMVAILAIENEDDERFNAACADLVERPAARTLGALVLAVGALLQDLNQRGVVPTEDAAVRAFAEDLTKTVPPRIRPSRDTVLGIITIVVDPDSAEAHRALEEDPLGVFLGLLGTLAVCAAKSARLDGVPALVRAREALGTAVPPAG